MVRYDQVMVRLGHVPYPWPPNTCSRYAFVVGMPTAKGRDLQKYEQGIHATPEEVEAANELRLESETYGDMHPGDV